MSACGGSCYCDAGASPRNACERNSASIAHCIVERVQGASASTLAYGYAMFTEGARVLFPIGTGCKEKRNAAGRCTRFECSYADGSRIVFTWSENNGPRYVAHADKRVR